MQNNTVSTLLMDSSVQQHSLHESDEKIKDSIDL